jgi:hypothetical protein
MIETIESCIMIIQRADDLDDAKATLTQLKLDMIKHYTGTARAVERALQ